MNKPLDLSMPLNISHAFRLTDRLSVVADAQTKFMPLALDGGRPMAVAALTINLKLEF